MKDKLTMIKAFTLFIAAVSIAVGFQNCSKPMTSALGTQTSESLELKSVKLRTQHCARCHDASLSAPEPRAILDDSYLISGNWIIPGNAADSILYKTLWTTMPKGQPRLSDADIMSFEKWINGLAQGPAQLTITDQPLFDFGTVSLSGSATRTFTIINTGGNVATSVVLSGLADPYAIEPSGTCTDTIAPGVPCTVLVRFTPVAITTSNDTLEIRYNDVASSSPILLSLNVTGVGTAASAANLVFNPVANGQFGVVATGTTKAMTFTVRNNGTAPASSMAINGLAAPFTRTGGTCAADIAVSGSCTLVVSYAPTSVGPNTATMMINYSNGTGTAALTLGLKGTGAGGVTPIFYSEIRNILNTSSCNGCHAPPGALGDWGNTYATLLNFRYPTAQGTAAIVASNLNSRFALAITTGTPQAKIMGTTGGYGNLSAANKQKILDWIVQGAKNDPVASPAVLTLSGASPVSFGNVNTSATADQVLTVTNTGGSSATGVSGSIVASAFSFKGGTFPGAGGTCTGLLTATSTCTIALRFAPVATGVLNANLVLNYNDSVAAKSLTRALLGTGVGASLASLAFVAPVSGDFGIATVGEYSNLALTVRNSGSANATALAFNGLAAPFVRTGGDCGTSLAIGASCTVALRFEPAAQGNAASTLTVAYNNGASAVALTLALSGRGEAKPATLVDFSSVAPILMNKCAACHTGTFGSWGGSASTLPPYLSVRAFSYPVQATPAIIAGNANSRFIKAITTGTSGGLVMGAGIQGGVNYGSLTSAEVQVISDWIISGALNSAYPNYFGTLIGDRYYVSSVLRTIYGSSTGVANITQAILNRADLLGSPCHIQDTEYVSTATTRNKNLPAMGDDCFARNSEDTRLNVDTMPSANTIAESARITACMKLSANTTYTTEALTSAGLTSAAPFNAASVTKAYQRFYPGVAPSAEVVSALINLGVESQLKLTTVAVASRPLEGWRYIFMALCSSPGWQAH